MFSRIKFQKIVVTCALMALAATVSACGEEVAIVELPNGKRYECSKATTAKLDAKKASANSLEKKLSSLKSQLKKLEQKYPDNQAPTKIADSYNAKTDQLAEATKKFNAIVDEHAAMVVGDCESAG